jgi:hypothetical protein
MTTSALAPRDVSLLTAITFHFVPARVRYFRTVVEAQPSLAGRVTVHVFTNTHDPAELREIEACLPPKSDTFDYRIISAPPQAHPFFLTWVHKQSLRVDFAQDDSYTHFMYIEDDILVTRPNLAYWLEAREPLRPFGLIPGFLRVERREHDGCWVSSDLRQPIPLWRTPTLRLSQERWFLNLRYAYQAMYLFDRALALEHLAGPAMSPEHGRWNIRERAAQGQTFVDVPRGFKTRNVVPFDPRTLRIEPGCHVHHLPNNYGIKPFFGHGTVTLDRVVSRPALGRVFARLRPARTHGSAER